MLAPVAEPDRPVDVPGTRNDGQEARHNRRRAELIAAVPAVLLAIVVLGVASGVGAYLPGAIAAVVVGIVVWLVLWRGATRFVLGALGAQVVDDNEVTRTEVARAENIVDGLCASMGVALPDIAVVDDPTRGALAIGCDPDAAVLVLTSCLLHVLDPVMLEAVLAHELVHVKRADIASATVAAAVLGPLGRVLPGAPDLVHKVAGRGREFRTDRLAVSVTRYPPGLRDALVLMAEGPRPALDSTLSGRGVARATRWLWTVAMPEPGDDTAQDVEVIEDELDAAGVRIAALDEW